jgi:hypothetical protein
MVGGRTRRRRFLKFTLFGMGGGNRAGRHRRAVGWAERASWAGREAEAQWREGERLVEKKTSGPRLVAGPIGPKVKENSFPNKNLIFEYTKALEICRRRFRRNFDMRIFPKIFWAFLEFLE